MRKYIKLILGIALMISSLYSATLKIETTWHYFGNGVLFGLGFALVVIQLFKLKKS
ncbi:MAG: hypothetical protein LC122_08660 [Chitinophagales bacterium]|nr:hypothetical protein [Chitinophagales bacterium]